MVPQPPPPPRSSSSSSSSSSPTTTTKNDPPSSPPNHPPPPAHPRPPQPSDGGRKGGGVASTTIAPSAAGGGATGGGALSPASCRLCLGMTLMTSKMRNARRPPTCYGITRTSTRPHPPLDEPRDAYIDEVLRSGGQARWTYLCVGASETLAAKATTKTTSARAELGAGAGAGAGAAVAPAPGAIPSCPSSSTVGGDEGGWEAPGADLAALPVCQGLLVFMDGEEYGEEAGMQQGARRRHRPGLEGSLGGRSTDTDIVGGAIGNRRRTSSSSSPSSTPHSAFPLEPPSSSALEEAARRVGSFWSNASEDFANKYVRSSRKLVGAMERQAQQVLVTGRRLVGGKWGGKDGKGEDGGGEGGTKGGAG
ncbi:Hypothetical protein NocV09_12600030 [Nannochloropsis oceanica]